MAPVATQEPAVAVAMAAGAVAMAAMAARAVAMAAVARTGFTQK